LIVAKIISSCFCGIGLKVHWGHDLTFRGHVTSSFHVTVGFPTGHFLWQSFGTKPLYLPVSEIFNGECDAMAHVTLNNL